VDILNDGVDFFLSVDYLPRN